MNTTEITAQRPPRSVHLDPFKPHAFFLEEERNGAGKIVSSATILLTNKECPWRCLMCDLWKNTLTYTIPKGAIPKQIQFALSQLPTQPEQVKLYNSGSFFDSAAIPNSDYPAIAQTVAFASHVIIESHPRLIGEKARRLRDLLPGSIEVAMGLETIHPVAFPRLNKKFSLRDFSNAAKYLRASNISVRVFILVNSPYLRDEESVQWTVRSAQFAFDAGASVVSLIPTRAGNGAMDALLKMGDFIPPKLSNLELAQEKSLSLRTGRVFADTWDLEKFSQCSSCLDSRRQRLHSINLTQRIQARIHCPACRGK